MANFLEFFNLREDPFKLTPDIDFYYMSKIHQEALGALEYLLSSEEGFAVIIGEPGTGKTITIRKFLSQTPENIEYAYILFPSLSPEEMFKAVLEDFGINIPENASKNRLFSMLRDFLVKRKKEGKKVLIIIDEAQNLPVETLEELRILSNLETEKEKLLQIILLGQPELENKLNSPQLRQLRQRISIISRLTNLSFEEMVDYINYRLAKAGNSTIRISDKAYKEIYRLSRGNLRTINLIMERALMSAFVDNRHNIQKKDISNAASSLEILPEKKINIIAATTIIFLIIIIVIGSFAIALKNKKSEEQVTTGVVNTKLLNFRSEPSMKAKIITRLKSGDKVNILEEKGEWLRIKKGGIEGWVKKEFITKDADIKGKTGKNISEKHKAY